MQGYVLKVKWKWRINTLNTLLLPLKV